MKSVEEVQQVKELKDRLELDRKGSLQVGLADRISRKPGDDDDPYAWLSQTAPASPLSQRRRRSTSEGPRQFQETVLIHMEPNQEDNEQTPNWITNSTSTSMDKLNKVKRKFKTAFHNSFDAGGVQRAKKSPSNEGTPLVERRQSGTGSNLFQRLTKRRESGTSSIKSNNESSSSCSSPEQDTVTRRPSLSSRGPHVKDLFPAKEGKVTAVLPDGQIMMASFKADEDQNNEENC